MRAKGLSPLNTLPVQTTPQTVVTYKIRYTRYLQPFNHRVRRIIKSRHTHIIRYLLGCLRLAVPVQTRTLEHTIYVRRIFTTQSCSVARLLGCTVHGCSAALLHNCSAALLLYYTTARLLCCSAARLMNTRLLSSWLLGCTIARLPHGTAKRSVVCWAKANTHAGIGRWWT